MTHSDSSEPDFTLVLNHAGVIQQAIAGNALAGERVSDWIGQPWVETVRDHARADIGQLVERAREGDIAGNRTAAAQLLGLSRQSLHTKLNRYGLDQAPGAEPAAHAAELTVANTAPN